MTVSRRHFLADASALAMIAALVPELAAGQSSAPGAFTTTPGAFPTEDLPHDSFSFWNGYFDSVNPYSKNYGVKAFSRGPADQLPTHKLKPNTCTTTVRTGAFAMPPTFVGKNSWTTMATSLSASLSHSTGPEPEKTISRPLNCGSIRPRFILS